VEQASQDQKEFWAVLVAQALQAPQVCRVIQVTLGALALSVHLANQVFAGQMAILAHKVLLDCLEILAALALKETSVPLDNLDLRGRREKLDSLDLLETLGPVDLLACQVICAAVLYFILY